MNHNDMRFPMAMTRCWLCGEGMGILLQTRAVYGEAAEEAFKDKYHNKVMTKEPCQKCKEWMKQGVILISVKDGEWNEDNHFRTGGWCVLKDDAIRIMVTPEKLVADILRRRVCFIPDEAWDALGLPRENIPPVAVNGN